LLSGTRTAEATPRAWSIARAASEDASGPPPPTGVSFRPGVSASGGIAEA